MPILANKNNIFVYSRSEQTESRSDYVYPYQYSGVAPIGSNESDPVWRIKRIDFTTFNSPITQQAFGSWDDRYLLIYT
jgi:hypothetical protein